MAEVFEADCDNCLGLCCTALRFSRADGFGHDKSAGEPCHYLDGHRCRIHARRQDLGYEGCIDFDCFGAGQRASAAFADPKSSTHSDVAALYARFQALMPIQEMRQALTAAAALDLDDRDHSLRHDLLAAFAVLADTPQLDLGPERVEPLLQNARTLIESWRDQ